MKTLKYSILFVVAILIYTNPLYSQLRHQLELIMNTREAAGKKMIFHLDKRYSYYIVWDASGNITTNPKIVNPGDVTITGNDYSTNYGWDGHCVTENNPWMGRCLNYKLSVEAQGKSASILVECYGTTFNYPGVDFKVIYYYDQDKFKDTEGNELSQIDLYDNVAGLQPTKPKNFVCTNPTQYLYHPNFSWDPPDWPAIRGGGRENIIIYYRIFRNDSEIDNGITSTSWSDEEVTLHRNGNSYTYYAKAYQSDSPDSKPSQTATIKGYIFKQDPAKEFPESKNNSFYNNYDYVSLSSFPNPFNPTTNISYHISKDGYVQIDIYNIAGQKIAELVNQYQYPGEYSVNFNGLSLAGGIYFVLLQFDDQIITKKVLLFK